MKFFHIGDLHFGKMLHNVPLIEKDQPYWVERFIDAVDAYRPDAVVIAGDVYDRRIPSPEAMKLFDHLLTQLAARDVCVFVIPGNHDSAVRLSHVSELLETHKIYIAGDVTRELTHVTVTSETEDVTFWLMPYIFPKLVSDAVVLADDTLSTYDEAARALIAAQPIDETSCNVLVAHQNVLANGVAPEHSESETIIGGLGEIDYTAFDPFDYVALGHIHNAQKVGRETVRYSGCPLYYDFSEIDRSKSLTMVTVGEKADISIEMIDIPILHRLRQVSGTLKELLEAGAAMEDRERYYIQCILLDKHVPPRSLEQLRDVYGEQLINVKRGLTEAGSQTVTDPLAADSQSMSLEEQFSRFYQDMQDELPDGLQEELIRKLLEQQARQGGEYLADAKAVPKEDSQEVLDYLLGAAEEDAP